MNELDPLELTETLSEAFAEVAEISLTQESEITMDAINQAINDRLADNCLPLELTTDWKFIHDPR